MKIFSITDKESLIKCKFCYRLAGTKDEVYPNQIDNQSRDESINSNRIYFDRYPAGETGIDICFEFEKNCYVDFVQIKELSGARKVEVFTEENGKIKCIGGENSTKVSVNYVTNNIILRLHPSGEELCVYGLEIIAADFENCIYPQPVYSEFEEGKAIDVSGFQISAGSEDEIFAAEIMKKNIAAKIEQKANGYTDGKIIIKKTSYITDGLGKSVFNSPETYSISIGEKEIEICGTDRRALIYAVHVLNMLMIDGNVPVGYVFDKPFLEFRGIHLGLPSRDNIEFFKSFIEDYAVPLRYNTLFWEVSAAIELESHPEISEEWAKMCRRYHNGEVPAPPHIEWLGDGDILTKDEIRDIVAFVKNFGIEIIPEIQSLAHVQYLTIAHPDIAERDTVNSAAKIEGDEAEPTPSTFYSHCYCPQNEKSYEILFDIADEIIDLIKPERYVSIGHDEVYQIGVCEKCKDKDPAELFAYDVNKIYDYLKKKGLKTMMWADMLHDVTEYKTPAAIDMIPKDIILLDFIWYFYPELDLENRLIKHGFNVIMGNMYSSHYPRYEKRIRKDGMLGAQTSTWCEISPHGLAENGKMLDVAYSANMMWSDKYTSEARGAYTYAAMHYAMEPTREKMSKRKGIRERMPERIVSGESVDIMSKEYIYAINTYGAMVSGDSAVDALPSNLMIADINRKVEKIAFTHCTFGAVPTGMVCEGGKNKHLGYYKINYKDSTSEKVNLIFGETIYTSDRYGEIIKPFFHRHDGYRDVFPCVPICGKCPDGKDYTLYELTWDNPYPEKQIVSIEMIAENRSGVKIALTEVKI